MPLLASEHPYALQAAGRWREAAAAWQAAGYPYEHAAALAESPDAQDRLAALAQLDALGAAPLARLVRAGLRRLGITHVPRGPVGATRQNPAGLTERQVQVLGLLNQGCTNAEIADRLVDLHPDGRQSRRRRAGQARRRDAAGRGRQGGRPRCPRPTSSVAAGADLGSGHGSARDPPRRRTAGSTDRSGPGRRRRSPGVPAERTEPAWSRRTHLREADDHAQEHRSDLLPDPRRGDRGTARAARLCRRLRPRRQGQGRHGGDRLRPVLVRPTARWSAGASCPPPATSCTTSAGTPARPRCATRATTATGPWSAAT